MREGDYDQAVAELRQAIAINPSDQRTQILLGEAETKAAEQRLQKAQQLLANHRPREARRELIAALGYVPTHPVAIREMATADEAIARSNNLLTGARAALQEQQWQQAADQAQAALAIDRSLSEAKAILTAAGSETTEYPSPMAAAPAAPPPPPPAEPPAPAPTASAAPPPRPRPSAISRDVQPPQPATALKPLARTPADRATQAAQAEMDAGRWSRALEILDQAVADQPDQSGLGVQRATAACRWAEELLHDADQRKREKAWDAAWIAGLQARVLCSTTASRADKLLEEAERALGREVGYSLGVTPLAADAGSLAFSIKVAKHFKTQLASQQARSVEFIGPPSQTEAVSPAMLDAANPQAIRWIARQVPKADLAVTVSVTAEAQDLRRPGEPGTSRYLVNKQTTRNPQYAAAEQAFNQSRQALTKIRAELARDESSYDAAGQADLRSERRFIARAATGYYGDQARAAAQDYITRLDALQNTPTQLEQDAWREHRYPTQIVERRVSMRLALQLVDLAGRRVIYRDESTVGQASQSDTTHDADEAHNVPAKEPHLPLLGDLQEVAFKQLMSRLREAARMVLTRPALDHLERARKLPGNAAGPAYVRFLFTGSGIVPLQQLRAGVEELWRASTVQMLREPCTQLTLQRLQLDDKNSSSDQANAFTGAVSVDGTSHPRELPALDGIVFAVRAVRAVSSADIDIRIGDRQLRYNGLAQGNSLTFFGQSGSRFRLTLVAIDAENGTIQFSLQRIP